MRGNATTVGGLAFTYDHLNQLVSVSGGAIAACVHDCNLKRLK